MDHKDLAEMLRKYLSLSVENHYYGDGSVNKVLKLFIGDILVEEVTLDG